MFLDFFCLVLFNSLRLFKQNSQYSQNSLFLFSIFSKFPMDYPKYYCICTQKNLFSKSNKDMEKIYLILISCIHLPVVISSENCLHFRHPLKSFWISFELVLTNISMKLSINNSFVANFCVEIFFHLNYYNLKGFFTKLQKKLE